MDDSDLAARLGDVRSKRGYLLPHHGLMAISMAELLEAYDELYTKLTLTERTLDRHEHELVWMSILTAMHEALGTHHIPRYLDAGGSADELESVLAMTALAKSADVHTFVDRHWLPHLEGFEPEAAYRRAFETAAAPVPLSLAHVAACAVHLCTANWAALRWQIRAAYAVSASEAGLAEALSLAMFPGSVPHFVDAAAVWRELILAGDVEASSLFKTWARLTGQGGYDEAAGKSGGDQ